MKEQVKKTEAFQREAETKAAKQATELDKVVATLAAVQQEMHDQTVRHGQTVERIENRFLNIDARLDQLTALITGLAQSQQSHTTPTTPAQLAQPTPATTTTPTPATTEESTSPPSRDRSP